MGLPGGAEVELEEGVSSLEVEEKLVMVEEDEDRSGEEHKEAGGLAWAVYRAYWRAVGGALAATILLSLLLMQGTDPTCPLHP